MKKTLLSLFVVSALSMIGCAVGSGEGDVDQQPAVVTQTGEAQSALTTGATDPGTGGGGGDTVDDGTGGTAERPKFDVASCVTTMMLINGWGRPHATAYCKCRAKGYSDWYCSNTISFIDL
jgi:hypothetical protein